MTQIQNPGTDRLDERILRSSPSPATACIILSEWYNRGEYDAVIRGCRDMLSLYPDDLRLRRFACLAYSALDFDDETSAEAGEIMERIRELADIFLLRAMVFQRSDKIREALDALGIYLALRPGDEAGIQLLEELQRTDPDQVSAPCGDTGSIPAVASSTIAELYLNQGLIGEALNTFKLVVASNPEDQKARRRLEELESEAGARIEDPEPAGKLPPENGYRAVLEQWRAGCREIFGKTSSTR